MEVEECISPAEAYHHLMRAVRFHLLMARMFQKHAGYFVWDQFADAHLKMARMSYDMARRIKG
jgi:hypothetical protein